MTDETDPWESAYVPRDPWADDPDSEDAENTWPLVSMVDTGTVWHYTTTAGLLGILNSGSLRASSAAMLNDTTEMTHGLEIVWGAVFDAQRELPENVFRFVEDAMTRASEYMRTNTALVACASTEGDDLAQWRAYAAGSGYAIGLRPSDRLCMIAAEGQAPILRRSSSDPAVGWGRVVYAPVAKSDLARRAVRFVASMAHASDGSPVDLLAATWGGVGALTTVVSHLKHHGFISESEVRLVSLIAGIEDSVRVQIRESSFGLTPFAELAVPLDGLGEWTVQVTTAEPGRLPIERIRVGPGPNQEAAQRGLETSLPLLGYDNVTVDVSKVPFR